MACLLKSPPLSFLRLASLSMLSVLCLGASGQLSPSEPLSIQPVAQNNRVPVSPDFSTRKQLAGHIAPWANATREVSSHVVDQASAMQLMITLKRDPAVQAAFDQLLADQQNPGSPLYHHWLTPEEIGQLYGPTQSDVDSLVSWLSSQGLTVSSVVPSRMLIHASGTVSTVGNAFQTSFAYYTLGDSERLANRTEPIVPVALSPVVAAISGLSQTFTEPMYRIAPGRNPEANEKGAPGGARPLYTKNVGSEYYQSAGDFQTIYDIDSVVTGGNTGATIGSTTNSHCPVTTAQCIAIIGRDPVFASDTTKYMHDFGAHGNTTFHLTQTQVPAASGGIPGGSAENNVESNLDIERVVGTANGAQAVLVYSENGSTDGIMIAASYNVNTLVYPIMSFSFASCEAEIPISQQTAAGTLFSQAAAEGITSLVASGDNAAYACHGGTPPSTTQTRSTNYLCASQYVTCVGGTQFADASAYSTYWNPTNDAQGKSAKSYIPEGAWNEPGTAGAYRVDGTGGGVSSFSPKPSFQTGIGVPADGYRDEPDISFEAAGHGGYETYVTVQAGDAPTLYVIGGTSASTPGLAGIVALLNTRLGRAVGNLNPLIYHLAATAPSAFHDVTVASSGVANCDAGTPSLCNNSTPLSATSLTGGLVGYTVNAGYDLATGWGSLDVANFLAAAQALDAGVNLSIASTHTNNFKPGDTGDTYTLTVGNAGATTTSGTITVVDTLPSGFTATAISGTGWNCTLATLTCTTTTAIANKTSANAITLTVNVSSSDVGRYTNSASVSGGGATGSVSTVDPTDVGVLPPVLAVSVSPAHIAPGGTSTWTYTFSNPATNAVRLTNILFRNIFPSGLTEGTPYGFSCSGGDSQYGSGPNDFIVGGNLNSGGNCIFHTDVTASSAGTYAVTTTTITSDQTNAGAAAIATLYVQTAPPITWTPSTTKGYAAISIGSGVLDASSTVAGTFAYTASNASGQTASINSGSNFGAGVYTLTATFTPTDTTKYTTATAQFVYTVTNQQVYVALSGGNTVSFFDNGVPQSGATSGGGIGAAVDATGFVWSINPGTNQVSKFTDYGTLAASYPVYGSAAATAIAIDGKGTVYTSVSNGTITAATNAGTPFYSQGVAAAAGIAAPTAISIDSSGSLWIASSGNNSAIEIIGAAAPVVTPTVTAVQNSNPGTRP